MELNKNLINQPFSFWQSLFNARDQQLTQSLIEKLYQELGIPVLEFLFLESPLSLWYATGYIAPYFTRRPTNHYQGKPYRNPCVIKDRIREKIFQLGLDNCNNSYTGINHFQCYRSFIDKLEERIIGELAPEENNIYRPVIRELKAPFVRALDRSAFPNFKTLLTFFNLVERQSLRDFIWSRARTINRYRPVISWVFIDKILRYYRPDKPLPCSDLIFQLFSSGVYGITPLDGICLVCWGPQEMAFETVEPLHNSKGPVLRFADGYDLSYWNGVRIPTEALTAPDKLIQKGMRALSNLNLESRRATLEIIGIERFASVLGGFEVLDEYVDPYGYPVQLVRTKRKEPTVEDYIYFVRVHCSSTGRAYQLGVPPWLRSAHGALAWTFQMNANEYRPQLET